MVNDAVVKILGSEEMKPFEKGIAKVLSENEINMYFRNLK